MRRNILAPNEPAAPICPKPPMIKMTVIVPTAVDDYTRDHVNLFKNRVLKLL